MMSNDIFPDYVPFPFIAKKVSSVDFEIDTPLNDLIEETVKSQIINTSVLEKILAKIEKVFSFHAFRPKIEFELEKESDELKEWLESVFKNQSSLSENIVIASGEDYMNEDDDFTTYSLSIYKTEEKSPVEVEFIDDLEQFSSSPFFSKTLDHIFQLKESTNPLLSSSEKALSFEQSVARTEYVENAILYIYEALLCIKAFKKIEDPVLKAQLEKIEVTYGIPIENEIIPFQGITISNLT